MAAYCLDTGSGCAYCLNVGLPILYIYVTEGINYLLRKQCIPFILAVFLTVSIRLYVLQVSVHCAHLSVDSIASSGHTPINKIRGHPETGEAVSGMKC